MDEPCSALDPISTSAIEETIVDLASEVTIALVTHNMFQATRCADLTAVFLLDADDHIGELVEYGATQQIFSAPSDPRTEQYVTGQVS
jgi:phosphate transport system ATP-binding protein